MAVKSYLSTGMDILLIFTESISIEPEVTSTKRNNAAIIELFPAPVLPTTPIFSQGLVTNVIPFKDGQRCSLVTII